MCLRVCVCVRASGRGGAAVFVPRLRGGSGNVPKGGRSNIDCLVTVAWTDFLLTWPGVWCVCVCVGGKVKLRHELDSVLWQAGRAAGQGGGAIATAAWMGWIEAGSQAV